MIRQNLIEATVPSSQRILDLIVHAENHKKNRIGPRDNCVAVWKAPAIT
jgi:hypothetical protein